LSELDCLSEIFSESEKSDLFKGLLARIQLAGEHNHGKTSLANSLVNAEPTCNASDDDTFVMGLLVYEI
jgi:tRNA U34 5-carboxymethylaminomethyl modifying GTPase MnmE/TrmE